MTLSTPSWKICLLDFWNEQHQSRECSFLDYELVQHEERFSHSTKCNTKCFIVGETDEIGEAT